MNIFVTDEDPRIAAEWLDDKRVIKMILESAQMLSTAMHMYGIAGAPYRATHVNHPCSVWARQTQGNYMWLLQHMQFLCMEYSNRFGRTHKCASLMQTFFNARWHAPAGPRTEFANCSMYKTGASDVIEAYRLTMVNKWDNDKIKPTWRCPTKPYWYP